MDHISFHHFIHQRPPGNFLFKTIDTSVALALEGDILGSLVVQQLDDWINKKQGFLYQDRYWISIGIKEWLEKDLFPWSSIGKVRTSIRRTIEIGVLKSNFLYEEEFGTNYSPFARKLYYTIDYERLNDLILVKASPILDREERI